MLVSILSAGLKKLLVSFSNRSRNGKLFLFAFLLVFLVCLLLKGPSGSSIQKLSRHWGKFHFYWQTRFSWESPFYSLKRCESDSGWFHFKIPITYKSFYNSCIFLYGDVLLDRVSFFSIPSPRQGIILYSRLNDRIHIFHRWLNNLVVGHSHVTRMIKKKESISLLKYTA